MHKAAGSSRCQRLIHGSGDKREPFVQLAGGWAMWTFHIIGINFQFWLSIDRSIIAQQNVFRALVCICFLSITFLQISSRWKCCRFPVQVYLYTTGCFGQFGLLCWTDVWLSIWSFPLVMKQTFRCDSQFSPFKEMLRLFLVHSLPSVIVLVSKCEFFSWTTFIEEINDAFLQSFCKR